MTARISGLAGHGRDLYGVSAAGGESLYKINPQNGAADLIGSLDMPNAVYDVGLDFDAGGHLWATLDYLSPPTGIPPLRNDIALLDVGTGARMQTRTVTGAGTDIETVQMEGLAIAPVASCIGGGDGGVGNDPIPPLTVPGPGLPILALLGALAAGLGLRRLRRTGVQA
jgi:hypothetical protein